MSGKLESAPSHDVRVWHPAEGWGTVKRAYDDQDFVLVHFDGKSYQPADGGPPLSLHGRTTLVPWCELSYSEPRDEEVTGDDDYITPEQLDTLAQMLFTPQPQPRLDQLTQTLFNPPQPQPQPQRPASHLIAIEVQCDEPGVTLSDMKLMLFRACRANGLTVLSFGDEG